MAVQPNWQRARNQLRKRGLSREQIALWMTLHRRTKFAQAYLADRTGEPWRVRDYQAASFESYAERKVHCDGRDVGKTTEIELIAAWASAAMPGREMLIATQCENHLFPLMDRIVRRIQGTAVLAGCLEEVRRTPSWYLRFTNGFVIWGRIAGPGGMNFQGMHVDWQIVDEAQEMTATAWGELFQALNAGGRRWVYGVPNGRRGTFYRLTQLPDAEQYNWPSSVHPDWTAEKEAELAMLYGGRESPGYINRVLGQHGAPSHAVFDLDAYLECVQEGLDFQDIALAQADAFDGPSGPVPEGDYYLGCDLGYARDPSEFSVFRAVGPDLVNVLRVHLGGVSYDRQEQVIHALDAVYGFRRMGIDAGNNGRAVVHRLHATDWDWAQRAVAIEFGGSTTVGHLPDGSPDRRPTKQFMTELIERRLAERTIVFPALPDREAQYAAHTYQVGASGQIVYGKGNDHLIDADRCALLAHYLDTHETYAPAPAPLNPAVEGW